MIYLTNADILNTQSIYSTKSLKDFSSERTEVETDGLYGKLYYSLGFLPLGWTLEPEGEFNSQDIADYLLANTINGDPRVSKVISDHFWDF